MKSALITMFRIKFPLLAFVIILTLCAAPASSKVVDGYGGSISTDTIEKGSMVRFTGSVHNYRIGAQPTIYVRSMNVTFVEDLPTDASRSPDSFNLSRSYNTEYYQSVPANQTFTDVMTEKVDIDPGRYLVSIYFRYSNTTGTATASQLGTAYSLGNGSVLVAGTTQALKVAQAIGWILGGTTVLIIGIFIYRRFKN